MHPVLIKGSSALSDFRLSNLVQLLEKTEPSLSGVIIKAEQIYIFKY